MEGLKAFWSVPGVGFQRPPGVFQRFAALGLGQYAFFSVSFSSPSWASLSFTARMMLPLRGSVATSSFFILALPPRPCTSSSRELQLLQLVYGELLQLREMLRPRVCLG